MTPLVCNLSAIGAEKRPRYQALVKRLRASMQSRSETAAGYVFAMAGDGISLVEVAEWMEMERLCCPFLTIEMQVSGEDPGWTLRLSGPDGVKSLLDGAFPSA